MMDETRFRAFYQEMFPRLWRYVHRLVNERSECDDVVQESFYRFLRTAPSGLTDADQRSYLYRIATNLVRDTWRSKKSEDKWLVEQGEDEPVSESEPGIVAGIDIARALAILSPGQRSLVWLAYVDGYEHKEIAEIVGVKPASVRVLLMRARKRLAEFLADDNDQIRDSV
jgi:RNA polymerase sigma-70 factor (ECF subfamily)